MSEVQGVFGSGSSRTETSCQICDSKELESVLFLGYLPPVNEFHKEGSQPREQASYPAEVQYCSGCKNVQLGCVVDPKILFSSEYPYTSSTTKILRENFAEMYQEANKLVGLDSDSLVIDIGSNDGNLLSNFVGNHRVLGITPEKIGQKAIDRGIPTVIDYFNTATAERVKKDQGKAKLICATNVFAHIDKVHDVIANIKDLLEDDGVFMSESHYLMPLMKTLQYDTVYHEHLRYYCLQTLKTLFERHGLEIFHAKQIPTHGGSVRVYACRKGQKEIQGSVAELIQEEKTFGIDKSGLNKFAQNVAMSKMQLLSMLSEIKSSGARIFGISAPSRAATLVNYCGIDDFILDCIVEVQGSHKIGKYMPGTVIPVVDEKRMFDEQPEYALLLSWHIADELIPKLWKLGFKGKFIVPLPEPKIVSPE